MSPSFRFLYAPERVENFFKESVQFLTLVTYSVSKRKPFLANPSVSRAFSHLKWMASACSSV